MYYIVFDVFHNYWLSRQFFNFVCGRLVTADVQGKPEQLFKKIADLNKSNAGPFDVLFCVGSFFGGLEDCPELDPYISGEKKGKRSLNTLLFINNYLLSSPYRDVFYYYR